MVMPVMVACAIFLSFALRIPLYTGKKFMWNDRASSRLGIEAMAANQSVGKRVIYGLSGPA